MNGAKLFIKTNLESVRMAAASSSSFLLSCCWAQWSEQGSRDRPTGLALALPAPSSWSTALLVRLQHGQQHNGQVGLPNNTSVRANRRNWSCWFCRRQQDLPSRCHRCYRQQSTGIVGATGATGATGPIGPLRQDLPTYCHYR